MRDIAIFLIVMSACVTSFKKPYYGFLCWVWLSLMNPHRMAYGWVHDMPVALITVSSTIFGTFFYKDKGKLFQHGIVVLQILFMIWMTISTINAVYPDMAYGSFDRAVKVQIGVLLSYLLVDTKEKIIGLVIVMFLSVGFYGVKGGIFTLLSGGGARVYGPPDSFIEDNNHLALALLMTIPLGFYLFTLASNKVIKNGLLGSIAAIGVSVLGSSSRGAFLGLIAVILFWMRKASGKQKAIVLVLSMFIAIVALAFMPEQWWHRMNTIKSYEQDASSMGRINAWWCAFNVAKNNITGAGFNYYGPEIFAVYAPDPQDVHAAHSIYFQVLGEHGFIGLMLYLLIAGWGWRVAGDVIRKTTSVENLKWANDLARMAQLSFIAYFSAGAFLSLTYYDFYWQLIAVIVILKGVVEKSLAMPVIKSEEKLKLSNKANDMFPAFVRPPVSHLEK